MGLCGSSEGFEDRFLEQVRPVRKMVGKLKVGDEEAKTIFKSFEKVDRDKSGQIDVDEFFNGLKIEPTAFGERVFKVADVSNDGEIDFGEFFVAIYNFCSFDDRSLLNFCFNIFDVDRSGSIDRGEVKALIKMMRGNSKKLDKMTDSLLKKLDTDGDGEMSIAEFMKMNKASPSMLAPAFEMKNQLTEVICGSTWWRKQQASRSKLNLGDLTALYTKLRDDGDMEKKLERRQTRIQKEGMGSGTVTSKKGAAVHVKPNVKAPVLSKLKKGALVDIAEDKTIGENANKMVWYRVGSKRWVMGKNIQVLSDDWKHKKPGGGGGGGGGGGRKKTKGKSAAGGGSKYAVDDPGDWQKHEDSSTGKSYWYSKKLKKTTWKDPSKVISKKKQLKVAKR
jgi:serine/threonine-protein phosphatase 2B regulatory subunit